MRPSNDSNNFESEYGKKHLQVSITDTDNDISSISNISMNENVCEIETSVLTTDESDTNQLSDSSETSDPFAIMKEVRKKF